MCNILKYTYVGIWGEIPFALLPLKIRDPRHTIRSCSKHDKTIEKEGRKVKCSFAWQAMLLRYSAVSWRPKKPGKKRGEEQEKYISRRSFDRTSFVRILSWTADGRRDYRQQKMQHPRSLARYLRKTTSPSFPVSYDIKESIKTCRTVQFCF